MKYEVSVTTSKLLEIIGANKYDVDEIELDEKKVILSIVRK